MPTGRGNSRFIQMISLGYGRYIAVPKTRSDGCFPHGRNREIPRWRDTSKALTPVRT